MTLAFNDYTLYHQLKTLIIFWYIQGFNHKSHIQPLEILLVEVTRTYYQSKI